MTTRFIPPGTGFSATVNGQLFANKPFYDVPDSIAAAMASAGFITFGAGHNGFCGPTNARPHGVALGALGNSSQMSQSAPSSVAYDPRKATPEGNFV
jgi:hypothetical protein